MSHTPRFDAAYAECLDDTGKVTRLEPIYNLCRRLEFEVRQAAMDEDEIPLPSVGVLTEAESARQVREDACRYYIEQIKHLETQLEGVSSSLLIANRDLDAANAKLFDLKGRAVCLYCQKEFEYKTAAGQQVLADHICSCDMNPVTKGFKEIVALSDELYALVEAYLCTPNTEPIIEDHYKALVAWFVRHKRPDGIEPRPVSPEQELL